MKIGSDTAEVTAGLRDCNAQCGNGKWPGNKSARADSSGTTLDATQMGRERRLSLGTPFFTASWSSPGSDSHTPGSAPARGFNSFCAKAEADAKGEKCLLLMRASPSSQINRIK